MPLTTPQTKIITIKNSIFYYFLNLVKEKRIYFHLDPNPDRRQPHSELDIYSTFNRDIYSVFSSVDTENNIAFFQIMINPLVRLVWYGAYILVFGTIIALWPSDR